MSDQPRKLVTPFDYDTPGKHCDFVRMPYSVHRSACGWFPLPIVCINWGDGPTVSVIPNDTERADRQPLRSQPPLANQQP